jgi:preprotein translocase subunit SecF
MPSFATFGNDLYAGRRSIDFVGRRNLWYAVGSVLITLSLLGLGWRGLNLGLEFKGGSEFRVSKASTQSETAGVNAVHSVVPGVEVRVSKLGTEGIRVTTPTLEDTQADQVQAAVAKAYGAPVDEVSTSSVGASWGRDVSGKALQGLIVFIIAVALVIALYFRTWKMALAAIVALAHDLVITVGVYALVGFEVTPATVIGFLTILGYSLYDTVVVFDKVRENTEHIENSVKHTYGEAANLAMNQTLVRSINTSVVALLPVGSILFIGAFLLGAGTLKDISLALFVGIAAGTYSSIFIATPMLVHLREREPVLAAQAERVRRKRVERGGLADATAAQSAGPAEAEEAALAVVGGGREASSGESAGQASSGSAAPGQEASPGRRQQPRRGGTAAGRRNRAGGRKR